MDKSLQKIVATVGFNYERRQKEFGEGDRVVCINTFTDNKENLISITFSLGRKEDDYISLVFPYQEFISKIQSLKKGIMP